MGDSVLQSDLWTNHLSSSVLSIASSVARHAISGSGPSVHRSSATTLSDAAPESFAQIIIKSLMRMLRGGKKASCRFMEM